MRKGLNNPQTFSAFFEGEISTKQTLISADRGKVNSGVNDGQHWDGLRGGRYGSRWERVLSETLSRAGEPRRG